MIVLGIDPGTEMSAVVMWDGAKVLHKKISGNNSILCDLYLFDDSHDVVIEMPQCYGMPVGRTVFETCRWVGMFQAYSLGSSHLVYRTDIKMHFCNSTRAKDSNIRQALIDRFGAPGTKKEPGVTHGVVKDIWAALAVAVYWYDTHNQETERKER